jgi:hypothetical protein
MLGPLSAVSRDSTVALELRSASRESAVDVLDAVTSQAEYWVARSHGGNTGAAPLGNFENGAGGWWAQSQFNTPPEALETIASASKYGTHSASVTCERQPACGPAKIVAMPFARGQRITVSAWVRGQPGTRAVLVVGASPSDYVASPAVALSRSWRQVDATWYPRSSGSAVEVAVQRPGSTPGRFQVDGVVIGEARPSGAQEERLFASLSDIDVTAARPSDDVKVPTATWALGGALVGFAVALASVFAGRLAGRFNASRGKEKPEKRPDSQLDPIPGDFGASDGDEARGQRGEKQRSRS